jgi:hypothetical protein
VKHTPDGKIVLEDGTPLRCRLTRSISSADVKTGDRIDFEVMDPIVLDGITIVPQGGIAWGTVTEAEHKKTMGRGGKLNVAIVAVRMANAERANLRAVKDSQGGGHVGAMTGAMVATAIVFFPAAPFFLFMKGKDITIPVGTEITAFVDGDKVFDPAMNNIVATNVPVPPQTPVSAPAPVTSTQLALSSKPDSADIEIDGDFLGSTPSSVSLAPGDHVVRLTKKGFQPYERKLRVGGGSINLVVELTPTQAQ